MVRLSELPAGQMAVIREFERSAAPATSYLENDREDIYLKLMEMGCIPGEEVSIIKIAPLGDPISISVAGYNLSLRRTEARCIWVEKVTRRIQTAY